MDHLTLEETLEKHQKAKDRLHELEEIQSSYEVLLRRRSGYRSTLEGYDRMTMDELKQEILKNFHSGFDRYGKLKKEGKNRMPNGLKTRESRVNWLKDKLWKGGETRETEKISDKGLRDTISRIKHDIQGVKHWLKMYTEIINEKRMEKEEEEWTLQSSKINPKITNVDFVVVFQRALHELAEMSRSSSREIDLSAKDLEAASMRLKLHILLTKGVLPLSYDEATIDYGNNYEFFLIGDDKKMSHRTEELLYEIIVKDLAHRKIIKLQQASPKIASKSIKDLLSTRTRVSKRPVKPLPSLPSKPLPRTPSSSSSSSPKLKRSAKRERSPVKRKSSSPDIPLRVLSKKRNKK